MLVLSGCSAPDYELETTSSRLCSDGEKNGAETDIDCGGSDCPKCVIGKVCRSEADCAYGTCTGGICRGEHCANGVMDENEEGVDCGGEDCPECVVEEICNNSRLDDDESDIDCGGPVCDPCDSGKACSDSSDCASGYCGETGICEDLHCTNQKIDETETDTDCGGGDCRGCAPGEACVLPRDCESSVCADEVCQEPSCEDGVKNGTEADKDCGGDCTASCPDGASCIEPTDCDSGVCSDGVCLAPSCDDDVQNGDETAVDCGGADCREVRACSVGEACLAHSDCAIAWCDPDLKVCTEPSCQDDYENGMETDRNCGGGTCEACEPGRRCLENDDCASRHCEESLCLAPTCDDAIKNQQEGGVDCGGGSACDLCADGLDCTTAADCMSGVCGDGVCAVPSCTDGVKNGFETDEDCGGDTDCPRCEARSSCLENTDCIEGYECSVEGQTCLVPECANGQVDEGETDQDCGGPSCLACADGMRCLESTDCRSLVCDPEGLTCSSPTCTDEVKNGNEPYADCGGSDPECVRCSIGFPCNVGTDCETSSCGQDENGTRVCLPETCEDGVKNGDELGIDCRGTTPVSETATLQCAEKTCAPGQPCIGAADCQSGVCTDEVCQSPVCDDTVLNGMESDVDCGGACPPCEDTQSCFYPQDCVNQVCVDNVCLAPTCEDGVANGDETGIDCGGPGTPCPLCPNGQGCSTGANCETGVCSSGTCTPPGCEDATQNYEETDVDCGGAECAPCAAGGGCLLDTDCQSLNCGSSLSCVAASCADRIINQEETDVDCGGPNCAACGAGQVCEQPSDCESLVCVEVSDSVITCAAATCSDQTTNQGESDVDCGGGVCTPCLANGDCALPRDCRSGLCLASGVCQQGEVEVYFYAVRDTQDIRIHFQIKNLTTASINLANYTLRYYFAHEPLDSAPSVFDAQTTAVTLVDEERVENGIALWHADIVPGAATVPVNGVSSMLSFRLHSNIADASYMDETNDYSWGPQTAEDFTDAPWTKIPVWRGTTLVFGIPKP